MADRTHLHAALQTTDRAADRASQIARIGSLGPDSFDCTEAQTVDQVRALDALRGYEVFWPARDAGGRPTVDPRNYAPIGWRTDRFDGTNLPGGVERATRGLAGEWPHRDFCWKVLRDVATGELVVRVSGHMVAGRQSLGDETPAVQARTIEAHAECVAAFHQLMVAKPLPTVGGTDANHDDLPRLINDARITYAQTGATHGRRRIDWVAAAGGASIASARVVDGGTSDHDWILAVVRTAAKEPTMTWRVARSLDILLAEINKAAPNRSKVSDGSIGDAAHASRSSDHNPWVIDANGIGVVRARDFTHDPADGVDCNVLAERLAALLGKHPALGPGAYVIWNRRIISTNRKAEGWRPYAGSNPHDKHVHLSVGLNGYDSTLGWGVMAAPARPAPPAGPTPRWDRICELALEIGKAGRDILAADGIPAEHKALARELLESNRATYTAAAQASSKH